MAVPLRVTKPDPIAVTIDDMRAHMLWSQDEVDSVADRKLRTALEASLEQCGADLSLALAAAEYEVRLSCWPQLRVLVIEFGPIREVVSIEYRDADGALQTLDPSNYILEARQRHAMIIFDDNFSAPDLSDDHSDRVIIRFAAGFDAYISESSAREIYRMPMNVRQAVFIRAEAIYEAGAIEDRSLKALNDAADSLIAAARVIRG